MIGVDIQKQCRQYAKHDVMVEIGSQDDPGFLLDLIRRYPPRIIIDDGSHLAHHVLYTFETLFPALEPGGIYVVEDLHFHSGAMREHTSGLAPINPIDYFFDLSRTLVTTEIHSDINWGFRGYARNWIDEILYFSHACAIRKEASTTHDPSRLDAIERIAASAGTADAWERAALFIKANGGSWDRGIAALQKAIGDRPSSRLYRRLSEFQAAAGRMPDALAAAQRAGQIHEDRSDQCTALEHYGNLLIGTRQIESAVEAFRSALELVTHPVVKDRILAKIERHQHA